MNSPQERFTVSFFTMMVMVMLVSTDKDTVNDEDTPDLLPHPSPQPLFQYLYNQMALTPFTAPNGKISGLKIAHIHVYLMKTEKSVFDGPITNLFSILCILILTSLFACFLWCV